MIRLRMTPSVPLSFTLATAAVAGQLSITDPRLMAGMDPIVVDLQSRLSSACVDIDRFWKFWTEASIRKLSSSDAIQWALLAIGLNEFQIDGLLSPIGRRLDEVASVLETRLPKLAEQLPLRLTPLRLQWDTYGAGLLKHVERQIWGKDKPNDWWPDEVNVWMVHPIRGGAGDLAPGGESIWMEAMLTDAPPAPPEVLRLSWLVLRLAIEQHLTARSDITNLRAGWSFASVPLILDAAKEIGMIDHSLTIVDAMKCWEFGTPQAAKRVQEWWSKRDPSQPMPIALRSLGFV
jgi:hypothetical protein